MKFYLPLLVIGFFLASCSSESDQASQPAPEKKKPQVEEAPKATAPDWMVEDFSDWPQILLTNSFEFQGERSSSGASAFLVQHQDQTLMCTAKHLLGGAMGIDPEVSLEDFNAALREWKLFARRPTLSADTLLVGNLISTEVGEADLILTTLKTPNTTFQALDPYLEIPDHGAKLYIIGCEYKQEDCYQEVFTGTMSKLDEEGIWVLIDTPVETGGFSGGPVIDELGRVVGVMSGSAGTPDEQYLIYEPITSAAEWLK